MGAQCIRDKKQLLMKKEKNNFMIFRVSDDQRKAIETHAKRQDKTMSAFVRDTFIQVLKKYSNDKTI
jgi:uncharacterized protein (DUF1778 family)